MAIHSYSQPSTTSVGSANNYSESSHHGIPNRCYCGATPIIATCLTETDPGRRFFNCRNKGDGERHINKWMDVAIMEGLTKIEDKYGFLANRVGQVEYRSHQFDLQQMKDKLLQAEEKLIHMEMLLNEIPKKNSRLLLKIIASVFALLLVVLMVKD